MNSAFFITYKQFGSERLLYLFQCEHFYFFLEQVIDTARFIGLSLSFIATYLHNTAWTLVPNNYIIIIQGPVCPRPGKDSSFFANQSLGDTVTENVIFNTGRLEYYVESV